MTPKELVLRGYKYFAEGDMDSLAKNFHENAIIKCNGDHEFSREYQGFTDWLQNFLAHIPIKYPNFQLDILNTVAEGNRVHVHVKLTADNLDAEAVHMFVVENDVQTEFHIFDDSQKLAAIMKAM